MAKGKNAKVKGEKKEKGGKKDKGDKKKGKEPKSSKQKGGGDAPSEPPKAPFIPFDWSKPRKERLSLDFEIQQSTVKNEEIDLTKHSQSTPGLLPTHKLDDLCAPSFPGVPPFLYGTEVKVPHVCLREFFSKDDMNTLQQINNKEEIHHFFEFQKNLHTAQKLPWEENCMDITLTFELLYEALRFSRVNKMTNKKTAAVLSIFYLTHTFFKSSLWHSALETYEYVKEAFLLHTIQRPIKSAEIFDPEECRSALLQFCETYLRNLPLIHLTALPSYQLRLEWQPKAAPVVEEVNSKPKGKEKKGGKGKKEKGNGKKK